MSIKEVNFPRIIIGATGSGCGKTTITCAILKALVNRGLKVASFKCGPDYIDTMFHGKITESKSRNLDPYFFSQETLKYILFKHGRDKDIGIIEGVMGYYDGISMKGEAGTYEVAVKTGTPTVLIVDAKAAALSVIAEISGFLNFKKDSKIVGVIFNRCSEMMHKSFAEAVSENFGERIVSLGFFPEVLDCSLESRHLGLVQAEEVEGLSEKIEKLGKQAEKSLDIDLLIHLSEEADCLEVEAEGNAAEISTKHALRMDLQNEELRIAVARDKAFSFYYEDSLEFLEERGCQLVPFSPLGDKALPENIQGLYLGGGYPEIYAKELSENISMRESIKESIKDGLPCIAECGGFMYLTEAIVRDDYASSEDNRERAYPMAGVLPGKCFDTGKLVRFGYMELTAEKDNLLCKKGEKIKGHEFHHWDCENPGEDFTAIKPSGRKWACAYGTESLYAGYPHFHFYANPAFGENFVSACKKRKKNR